MNIKYLKHYVNKCIRKGIQPTWKDLRIWYESIDC
jgi:hypothetical protein